MCCCPNHERFARKSFRNWGDWNVVWLFTALITYLEEQLFPFLGVIRILWVRKSVFKHVMYISTIKYRLDTPQVVLIRKPFPPARVALPANATQFAHPVNGKNIRLPGIFSLKIEGKCFRRKWYTPNVVESVQGSMKKLPLIFIYNWLTLFSFINKLKIQSNRILSIISTNVLLFSC